MTVHPGLVDTHLANGFFKVGACGTWQAVGQAMGQVGRCMLLEALGTGWAAHTSSQRLVSLAVLRVQAEHGQRMRG